MTGIRSNALLFVIPPVLYFVMSSAQFVQSQQTFHEYFPPA